MNDRPNDPLMKPTAGAMRALGLAGLVNKVFAGERVPSTRAGHRGYRVEMAGPDTLSTAQSDARDHLWLVPVNAADAGADAASAKILIAMADPNLSQLEVRSYDQLKTLHAERAGGESLPIDSTAYEALRKKIEEFFERQGIATISSAARSPLTNPPRQGVGRLPLIAGALLAVAALLAIYFFAVKGK